ncbi:HNH endonuclease [Mycolicibacterium palauense]|uniref:HNH endonuclease n=1 Tax=Mycolicibacterium palauense TaxID=2034511 RepID=UPI000BFED021
MQRPCLGCGYLIDHGSRCNDCRPKRTVKPGTKGRTATDWRWRKLSQKLRRLSPFCEKCLATTDLTVDHVIPPSERPDLTYDELNLRVWCRSCNGSRSNRVTDQERQQVLDAIAQRRTRKSLRLRDGLAST